MIRSIFKKGLLTGMSLVLAGCGSASHYYVISVAKQPAQSYRYETSIGVEQVILPAYMDKRKLTIATSDNQIVQLGSAVWAEDMDAALTQRLISFLQKKFNQPKVFAYPWGTDIQPKFKLRVQINRFVAQGEHVYLDANYVITNISNKQKTGYLFNIAEPSTSNASDIVNAMDRAFGKLEEDISIHIKQ